jgi:hypothetical protein
LRDQIYVLFRRAIVTGKLAPGALVNEIEIADKLGISRTPVREAVKKVSDEGLIEVRAQAGTFYGNIVGLRFDARHAGNRPKRRRRSMSRNPTTTASARGHDRVRNAQELRDKSARCPVRPHGINDDPPLGGSERPEHDAVYFDMRQRAGNEGDALTGLHQHQCRLEVLDFGGNPNVHMQRIEHIEDVPAASRTAIGMSDDDILTAESGRVELGPTSEGMTLRECRQPLIAPHGIADDRRSLNGRKHQAKVDPTTLQCSNLLYGGHLQQVEMQVGPLFPVGGNDARERASHHVLRRRQP